MTEQIFDKAIGLILDIRLWSGSKNLKAEDFLGVELPPEELVSLGSKRIHNKDTLKPIQAVRTKTVSYMEAIAVSLYGGKVWIIPADKLDEAQSTLTNLADEFESEKTRFLQDFYMEQNQWLEKNKKWASILNPYLETSDTVEKKFGFTWRTFRMSSAQDDDLADTISSDVTSNLLKEISVLAAEACNTLGEKDRATPKNLNRLDRLAGKLRGLAFVDPGVGLIEQELSQILQAKSSDGTMSGQDVFKLTRLLVQLKNPCVLNEILEAARKGRNYKFTYNAIQIADDASVLQPPAPAMPRTKPIKQPRLPDAWF